MKHNIEIDPMAVAYFAGQLTPGEKEIVKQRFATDAAFQVDFLLEEERVRRKYAAMLREIDPRNVGGRKPVIGRWTLVVGMVGLSIFLLVGYFLLTPPRATIYLQKTTASPDSQSQPMQDSVSPQRNGPENVDDAAPTINPPMELRMDTVMPKANDSMARNRTILASHLPGVLHSSWERKESDRDPGAWLGQNGAAIPSILPDYLWESVVRGKMITNVPIYSFGHKRAPVPDDKPKENIEVIVFQTAYLPVEEYYWADSLWLFLSHDLRSITVDKIWMHRNGSGSADVLHIGDQVYEIRPNGRVMTLRRVP